jgi:hypothetical protein
VAAPEKRKVVGEMAGEVGAPFWGSERGIAHQTQMPTLMHDGHRGSLVASHKSGGGSRLTDREGAGY